MSFREKIAEILSKTSTSGIGKELWDAINGKLAKGDGGNKIAFNPQTTATNIFLTTGQLFDLTTALLSSNTVNVTLIVPPDLNTALAVREHWLRFKVGATKPKITFIPPSGCTFVYFGAAAIAVSGWTVNKTYLYKFYWLNTNTIAIEWKMSY